MNRDFLAKIVMILGFKEWVELRYMEMGILGREVSMEVRNFGV